jgi:hypothetical protein
LLRETRTLGSVEIRPGSIHLATNRIRIELISGDGDDSSGLWIDLEERSGTLAAGVSRPGWLAALDADERRVLGDALAGLYKLSGVERVHTPGSAVVPDAPAVDFDGVVIRWADWVQCWEHETSGTPPVHDWPGLLPEPGASPAPVSSRESGT